MPVDPNQLAQLLASAFERQAENYTALKKSVTAFHDSIVALAGANTDATNDQVGAPETAPADERRAADTTGLLGQQQQALLQSQQTEKRIAVLQSRLAAATGLDEITISGLRKYQRSKGDPALEKTLDRLEKLTNKVVSLARNIAEMSAANEELLAKNVGALTDQIGRVRKSEDVAKAYGRLTKGRNQTPRFFDREK